LPALELLDEVLSGGRASVLVDELVHRQEVLAEVETMLLPMDQASLFLIRGRPADGIEPAAALTALEATLARVRMEPQPEPRIARARKAAQLSLVQQVEGVEGSADLLATWELWFGGWERLGERPARWAEVGPGELRVAAERWLAPERRNTVVVLPVDEPAAEEAP
jgi:predicted Zn-dependent peptidase